LVTGVLVMVLAVPGGATELDEVLEDSSDAVYSGRRLAVTVWQGVSSTDVYDVEQAAGTTMVGGRAVIREGSLHDLSAQGHSYALSAWNEATPSHQYIATTNGVRTHLGRICDVVDIHERGVLRSRVLLDRQSSAPLLTEVYDAAGEVFRSTSMIEFSPFEQEMPAPALLRGEYEMVMPRYNSSLPRVAGGYERFDVYAGPGLSEQGFYGDGLFSFSLFRVGAATIVPLPDDAIEVEIGGATYDVVVAPSELWLTWTSDDDRYVLVGDLPPDHLEDVLLQLPRPAKPNWFQRVWRSLFG
jgi:hypothetical protein